MTRSQKIGSPFPLGCSFNQGFWNFAIYSETELESVCVSPFEKPDKKEFYPLEKTGRIFHTAIEATEQSIRWGWKAPNDPLLYLDPYAQLLATGSEFGNNQWPTFESGALLSTHSNESAFDWEDAPQISTPLNELIIYEMHLKGYTDSHSSHVEYPGTYLGMIEKIPHLKQLGINAVELLPIFEFNEMEWNKTNPKTHERLYNYWGYSTLNFFSPMMRYGTSDDPFQTSNELKQLIKALHQEGIAVILDVVFNHTGEGSEQGKIYCFKKFAPNTYYLRDAHGVYYNYSGCGNSINASHPVVSDLILSSLKHWTIEYKIDGFRFDLASEMTRNSNGAPSNQPPLFERILEDPILKDKYLLVEPWDAAGLHQTGQLYKMNQWHTSSIAEWNDDYRDTIRKFIRGDENITGKFASKICGSEDLYSPRGSPLNSLNFVTCHDGFTLRDLVSYNTKHNFENGEHNHDGTNNNLSWNCGHEGESHDSRIEKLRERQMKNFLCALFLSHGIPMILSGDEYGHTKRGNNNTWCQNNELNWFHWPELHKNAILNRFVKDIIELRKRNLVLIKNRFMQQSDIEWHGKTLFNPNWTPSSKLVNCTFLDEDGKKILHAVWNSSDHTEHVEIPLQDQGYLWKVVVNTAQLPPRDISAPSEASTHVSPTLTVPSKTCIVLERA